jgi:hypothetical protein
MPVCTATEVTVYSDISASAATVAALGLIPIVQERIVQILNSYFTTDIQIVASCTFNPTANTIVINSNEWATFGFADGDEVHIKNSFRNDGYVTVSSFSASTATLATASSVVSELSQRSVLFSLVKWPLQVKRAAALMVAYDYDDRPQQSPGVRSFSLGPFSETYGAAVGSGDDNTFGYPPEVLANLPMRTVRML